MAKDDYLDVEGQLGMLKCGKQLLRMAGMCTVTIAKDEYLDVTVQLWMTWKVL